MITDAIKSKGKRQLAKIKKSALYFFRITKKKKPISALLIFAFCFLPFNFAQAQEAIGTSVLPESKVWFTLRDGILGEAHYPNLKSNHLSELFFVITDGKNFAISERDKEVTKQMIQTNPISLTFRQISTHPKLKFTLTKTYCAYPDYSTVLVNVDFHAPKNYQLFVVFNPAMANSEANDTANAFGGQGAFSVYENNFCAALIAEKGFAEMSVDAIGTNDGLQKILRRFKLTKVNERTENSDVICVARIKQPRKFMLALAFSDTPEKALIEAEHCLEGDFEDTLADYEKGWSDWLKTNNNLPSPLSAMLRQAHEKK